MARRRIKPEVTAAEANAAADAVEAAAAASPPAKSQHVDPEPTPPLSPFGKAKHQTAFPKPRELRNGFETITKKLFADGYDPVAEWEAISEALEIQGALTPQTIEKAANKQERIADRAFRLYVVARREYATYMRETEPIVGAIREAATAKLEIEKRTLVVNDAGKKVALRTKMITDADVASACAQYYGDEWLDVNDKRDRANLMLKQIENLAELAKQRAYTASKMLSPGGRRVAG